MSAVPRSESPVDVPSAVDESVPSSPPSPVMTETAFLEWALRTEARAEWVDGRVIVMAPANFDHSDVHGWVYRLLGDYVEERALGVAVLDAFTRLRAPHPEVRAPDIAFVSNARRQEVISSGGALTGAPDLVVEVVSGDSQSRDRREKYLSYEAAGVREYWIIDPFVERVEAHLLNAAGRYEPLPETAGRIGSAVVDGFQLRPAWLWQDPRPTVRKALTELGLG